MLCPEIEKVTFWVHKSCSANWAKLVRLCLLHYKKMEIRKERKNPTKLFLPSVIKFSCFPCPLLISYRYSLYPIGNVLTYIRATEAENLELPTSPTISLPYIQYLAHTIILPRTLMSIKIYIFLKRVIYWARKQNQTVRGKN